MPEADAAAQHVPVAAVAGVVVGVDVEQAPLAAEFVRPQLYRALVLDVHRPSPVSRASLEIEHRIVETIAGLLADGTWQGKLLMPAGPDPPAGGPSRK
jgi:hypothetical protein